jgi:hypothetical protein
MRRLRLGLRRAPGAAAGWEPRLSVRRSGAPCPACNPSDGLTPPRMPPGFVDDKDAGESSTDSQLSRIFSRVRATMERKAPEDAGAFI